MSPAVALALDHVGVAAHSLDAVQATYEGLGFRLTSRSMHSGALTPGGPIQPWGSGNHCAMFQRGYLELLGITDPSLHSSAKALLEQYEGAHIVAFAVPSADDAYTGLSHRTRGINPVRAFERDVPYGVAGTETRRAAFRAGSTDKNLFPEGRFVFVEHLTPDVLWQPHLLEHPNGAVALNEVVLCAADLAATRDRLTALLGLEPCEDLLGGAVYALSHGRLRVVTPATAAEWAPDVVPPRLPYVAGVGVSVVDLDQTRQALRANGVPVRERAGARIWVHPRDASGIVLSFTPVGV